MPCPFSHVPFGDGSFLRKLRGQILILIGLTRQERPFTIEQDPIDGDTGALNLPLTFWRNFLPWNRPWKNTSKNMLFPGKTMRRLCEKLERPLGRWMLGFWLLDRTRPNVVPLSWRRLGCRSCNLWLGTIFPWKHNHTGHGEVGGWELAQKHVEIETEYLGVAFVHVELINNLLLSLWLVCSIRDQKSRLHISRLLSYAPGWLVAYIHICH